MFQSKMEELSRLRANPRLEFLYASPSTADTEKATASSSPSSPPWLNDESCDPNPNFIFPLKHSHQHQHLHLMAEPNSPPIKPEANTSQSPHERRESADNPLSSDADAIKARIISHPLYSSLVSAYMDCQKVGAPPEVVARIASSVREFKASQRGTPSCRDVPSDPELDRFMEAYFEMLMKYREELTKPLQEAMDFLKKAESQLNSITNIGSARIISSDDEYGVNSLEEDQEGSGGESELPDVKLDHAEDKEIRRLLLKKYSGHLGSLRQELSKKKKNGKLPNDARQKLLNWWELHYKWPYPSETEKVALAESTGLDQKQINNWFINQRKRHWKPSEDMQLVVMNGYYPQDPDSIYMEGNLIGNTAYRLPP